MTTAGLVVVASRALTAGGRRARSPRRHAVMASARASRASPSAPARQSRRLPRPNKPQNRFVTFAAAAAGASSSAHPEPQGSGSRAAALPGGSSPRPTAGSAWQSIAEKLQRRVTSMIRKLGLDIPGSSSWLLFFLTLWAAVGTAFYATVGFNELPVESTGWGLRIAAGFYYAMEAGLSVGFGKLSEVHDPSRVFTICYVVAGSVFKATALATFVVHATEQLKSNLHRDDADDTSEAVRARQSQDRASAVAAACLCVAVVGIGTAFGMLSQGWSLAQSAYYALTAISSGGLQAVETWDAFGFAFTGLLLWVGVPIYAYAICCMSLQIVYRIDSARHSMLRRRAAELARQSMDEAMHASAAGDGSRASEPPAEDGPGTAAKSLAPLEAQLTSKLVIDKRAVLLCLFDRFDADRSGYLEVGELTPLIAFLMSTSRANVTTEDVEFLLAEFDTQETDGKVSREEFVLGLERWMAVTETGGQQGADLQLMHNGRSYEDHWKRNNSHDIAQW